MAKLSTFKRIRVEDFDSKDRALVEKLSYPINSFADQVIGSFNNNITIQDNLNWSVNTFTITLDATGAIVGGFNLRTNLNHTCAGCLVINVQNLTNPTVYPTSTPFISYVDNNGLLSINNISSLAVSTQYRLTVILF